MSCPSSIHYLFLMLNKVSSSWWEWYMNFSKRKKTGSNTRMNDLFCAALKAAQGAQPLRSDTMKCGSWTESKKQNSKDHQLSLPLLSPVLGSAWPETWAGAKKSGEAPSTRLLPSPTLAGEEERKGWERAGSEINDWVDGSPSPSVHQWNYTIWAPEKSIC